MDNAEQDARGPSAEQIAESRNLAEQYGHMVYGRALAMIIAHVRQQAERAALENAAKVCDKSAADYRAGANRNPEGSDANELLDSMSNLAANIARDIRALMQPEQKGKG